MSYKGFENPSSLPCWRLCTSCFRCADKGKYAKCSSCSGRHDPELRRDPYYIDDACRCTEGVLTYRTKWGKWIVRRFLTNPFKGKVTTDAETQDERDWNSYITEQRQIRGDESWDPVQFTDGSSTTDWARDWKRGR